MEYEIYKKIQLHKTFDFLKEKHKVFEKKEYIEKIFKENFLEYVFEIREDYEIDVRDKVGDIAHCLDVIIKESDLLKVEEILKLEKIEYKIVDTIKIENTENTEKIKEDIYENLSEDEIKEIKSRNKFKIFSIVIIVVLVILIFMFK